MIDMRQAHKSDHKKGGAKGKPKGYPHSCPLPMTLITVNPRWPQPQDKFSIGPYRERRRKNLQKQ